MQETWLPLGPIGVITAFNFPVAVWAWNAALALVCGDPVVWKPSEKTPLTALACQAILAKACRHYTHTTGQPSPRACCMYSSAMPPLGTGWLQTPVSHLSVLQGAVAWGA